VPWPRVLHRVNQGEPLSKVANEYGVSYETVRRVIEAVVLEDDIRDGELPTGSQHPVGLAQHSVSVIPRFSP
jgi:hypothetical protein